MRVLWSGCYQNSMIDSDVLRTLGLASAKLRLQCRNQSPLLPVQQPASASSMGDAVMATQATKAEAPSAPEADHISDDSNAGPASSSTSASVPKPAEAEAQSLDAEAPLRPQPQPAEAMEEEPSPAVAAPVIPASEAQAQAEAAGDGDSWALSDLILERLLRLLQRRPLPRLATVRSRMP
jgi:hypothetical protein